MASSRTTALTSFGLGVALTIAGATLTGVLNLGGNNITNVGTATVQTLSGSEVRVKNKLLASGSLVVEGNSTFQSPILSTVTAKATVSGTALRLNQPGAGLETDPLCVKVDGSIGYLPRSATGSIGFTCT